MTTEQQIYSALHEWINEFFEMSDDDFSIRANQNGYTPQPRAEYYFTYQIVSGTPSSYSNTTKVKKDPPLDNFVEATYLNRNDITISVEIYEAIDGREKLAQLEQSRYRLETRLIFQPLGMVLLGCGEIRDLTELGDTDFKPRYQADFNFAVNSEVKESYERILEVEIDGAYNP
jgi:hypothetical protein